jgi:two-component system, OmpR family, heavy metal sensor histidine kinase CusS
MSPGPPSEPRNWSMTRKLTLYLTLSFCGLLFVSSFLMYLELVINLEREQNNFIDDDIAGFRNLLSVYHEDPRFLREEILLEGAGTKNPKYIVRVQDGQGNLLVESPRMEEKVPLAGFPLPAEMSATHPAGVKWKDNRGKPFLLKTVWLEDGSKENKRYKVQIALDITSQETVLANYRQMMAIELVLGIIISAITCIVIIRRGMSPLQEITETTQRISASRLHERIAASWWPKEVTPLAVAFDDMLDRLEDSFNRLSRFSANLAHELRTPINSLMGTADVTLAKERTPEEYRQVIESSLEEYNRLSRMIERLLFLARATNNEIRIERLPLDLPRELARVHELYSAMAEEQGVEIICHGEGTVHAEPELFGRAVSNLLANALQHTPPGGMITLAGARVSEHLVEVRVSDTGTGISAEHLPRIFDRFYRVDSARSRASGGIGLGLAIVKSIMELHGGTVSVESSPNQGTTFILGFPVV